jgi:hypothetical protein
MTGGPDLDGRQPPPRHALLRAFPAAKLLGTKFDQLDVRPMFKTIVVALFVIAAGAAMAQASKLQPGAQPKAGATPKLGNHRLYLIWADSGAMSADLAPQKSQIVATDRKLGGSLQARFDTVIEAPSGVYDDVMLTIRVTSDGKAIIDQKFPVGFIDRPGRLIRAVIVNHECQPFEVETILGGTRRTVKYDLTCGG